MYYLRVIINKIKLLGNKCVANLERLINADNQKMLKIDNKIQSQSNCASCCKYNLKWGNCCLDNIIYKVTVNYDLGKKFYIGFCSTQFRFGYANHKISFKGVVYKNITELSKYICDLKHKNIDFRITWEVIKRVQHKADGNNPVRRLC